MTAGPRRLQLDPVTGLLDGARQAGSPNCDDRPPGSTPELIVIHGISLPPGEFGGPHIEALFRNCLDTAAHPYFLEIDGLCVSAHLLIRRNGELIQFVPVNRRAWHAGASCWQGREACNDFSVGIELEGADDVPYTDPQYASLSAAIAALREALPGLRHAPVVGHSDIAPGRKTDPGEAFDWARLESLLARPPA